MLTNSESGWADNDGVRLRWVLDRPAGGDPATGVGVDGAAVVSPLLLVNGLGSPLVAFEAGFVAGLVERGLAVARFDNRDVGRSDRVERGPAGQSTPYTVADLAADAVAVLDAIGWSSAHLLGQSMGGMIVQQVAIDHPGRVRSLLPFMTSSGEPGFGRPTDDALEALLQPAPTERRAWVEHRVATERVWASPAHWSPQWLRAKSEAMWDHGIDAKGTFRQFRALRAAASRDEALRRVDVPALVLHGSADTLVAPDGGRHLADVIPGAVYHEIDGLGHDLPPGLWEAVSDPVAAFVAEIDRRSGPESSGLSG